MAKIVLLTRAQFWRVALAGWFGGFFLCRIVERFVNPQVREEVATVLVIGAFVLVFIGAFILVFTSGQDRPAPLHQLQQGPARPDREAFRLP